jgi:peptidoglycan/LPS O-acetylase OafA/YrhL
MGMVRRQREIERRLPVKKTGFIPRLESLRGIAALTVVGYHVNNQLSGGSANGWLDTLASRLIGACANGSSAVVTFFVLSGFVLARPLDSNPDPVRFLRNRVFRLFPAAAMTVTLKTGLREALGRPDYRQIPNRCGPKLMFFELELKRRRPCSIETSRD